MKSLIISIGDELLIGQTINTNAARIGQMLLGIGIPPAMGLTISDSHDAILNALQNGIDNYDIVITTGGLGPTKDDITKHAVCEVTGSELVFSQQSYDHLASILGEFGKKPSEAHREQCYLPSKAQLMHNGMGTAPGMHFDLDGKHLFVLPGVPYEMDYIMQHGVIPSILQTMSGVRKMEFTTFCTAGMGESDLAEKLSEIEEDLPDNFSLAYLPSPGSVRLRVMALIRDQTDTERYKAVLDQFRQRLGSLIYAEEDIPLAKVIGQLLEAEGSTLSVAESCTGGFTGHLITSIPGSSAYFQGGGITYSNHLKQKILGVSADTLAGFGAVSEQTAREMAEGARREFDTDYAISITGIAGPDGGSDEKPVGTVWIAVATRERTIAKRMQFTRRRALNIELSATAALNMLRKVLIRTD